MNGMCYVNPNSPDPDGSCVHDYDGDCGYATSDRGWYDLQGCGYCHDYCRWVGCCAGNSAVSGTCNNPSCGTGYFACHTPAPQYVYAERPQAATVLAFSSGSVAERSIPFLTRSEVFKCSTNGAGEKACFLNSKAGDPDGSCVHDYDGDCGYATSDRGWYDLQGCGYCHDYCRWVGCCAGNSAVSGSCNNPSCGTGYFACHMEAPASSYPTWALPFKSGSVAERSVPFDPNRMYHRCDRPGQKACFVNPNFPDPDGSCAENYDGDCGYATSDRGWYDLQGCGYCHDYCRWVGCCAGNSAVSGACGSSCGYFACHTPAPQHVYMERGGSAMVAFVSGSWSDRNIPFSFPGVSKCSGPGAVAP